MDVFLSRTAPVKTKEDKKVSRLAKRVNSSVRERCKPSPVVVVYTKGE